MPDKKTCKVAFVFFLHILKFNPCLRNIIYCSVISSCVSQQRIKTTFKVLIEII